MLAVENSTYGRVADVHSLLPRAGLHIVDEAFVRVHVNLLGVPGATVGDVTEAHGHVVILPQCALFLKKHGIKGKVSSDNARAAREGRTLLVGPRTIVTPAARDAGAAFGTLVWLDGSAR